MPLLQCVFSYQQIKQQRDKVKQFQKKLVVQLESETEIIKQLVQNDKKP